MGDIVPDPKIAEHVEDGIDFLQEHFTGFFTFLNDNFQLLVDGILDTLMLPGVVGMWALIVGIALLAGGWRLGAFGLVGFGIIESMGLWGETMQTLALVLASGAVCFLFGVPLGILMARSNAVKQSVRPVLDLAQTMPAFVYLIPAILFFDIGAPAALLSTVLFAFPPLVRLVAHGIEQVDKELVEASDSFGANGWQTLTKVQIPLAMPSIMVGVNQMLMLSLSMAVIASMVGFAGLGRVVMDGISRLDAGIGFEGGIGIVILAITLDRVTQALGERDYAARGGFVADAWGSVKRTFTAMARPSKTIVEKR